MAEEYNPIRWVDKVAMPCPSAYEVEYDDVSSSEAGRTEDVVMDKMKLGQVVGLSLTWKNVYLETISKVLQAFNPEYIDVCYLDPKLGTYATKEFYVGNRTATAYNCKLGVWTVSFNIISRDGKEATG